MNHHVTGGRDSCQDLGCLTIDALHEIPYVLLRTIQQNSLFAGLRRKYLTQSQVGEGMIPET